MDDIESQNGDLDPIYTVENFLSDNSIALLLRRAQNRIAEGLDKAVHPFGVGIQEIGILRSVMSGMAGSPTELARLRHQNGAAVTYTLDMLEDKQLIRRTRSAEDRRVLNLELTEKGEELMQQCLPVIIQTLNRLVSGFSVEEHRTLSALLKRLAFAED